MVTRLLRRSFLPVIPFFAALAAALALYLEVPVEAGLLVALAVAAFAITSSSFARRDHRVPAIALTALALLAGSLAANRSDAVPLLPSSVSSEGPVTVLGRSLADSGETPSGLYRVPVEVDWVDSGVQGVGSGSQSWQGRGILLFRRASVGGAEDDSPEPQSAGARRSGPPLLWGDRFRATIRLWCPEGGRDCFLLAEEVSLEQPVSASWSSGPRNVAGGTVQLLTTLRRPVRRMVGAALTRLPGDVRPLTGALVLGDRSYLSAETVDSFRRGGVSHVLALSGMHLGIVAGSVLLLLGRLSSERLGIIAALTVTWGYLLLVGPGASLLRAAAMFTFWALSRLLSRRPGALTILGSTFLLFVFLWPSRSGEVGFWFSFLALAGLLLLGPPVGRVLERWLPPFLAAPFGVSIAAFLATAPLSLALFGFAAPVGILASVVIAPVVLLVLWCGILLLGGAAFGFLLLPVYRITAWLQSILLFAVDAAATAPIVTVDPGLSGSWVLGLIPLGAAAVIALLRLEREGRRRNELDEESALA